MTMLNIVSSMCSVFAVICFILYVYQSVARTRTTISQIEGDRADAVQRHGAVADMGKLIEAFAKLSDSLEKAGPLTGSLIGAMFFAVLAAVTAGLGK
jgi:hypothetical protein